MAPVHGWHENSWSALYLKKKKRIWTSRKGPLRPEKDVGTGNSGCQSLKHDLEWGEGGALMEHILSALQISYLAERGTARGGPEYGLLNWELGQESHLPELKVILIAMASSFHSCTPLFHLYSTRVNHLKHKCGLSFRLWEPIRVFSSLTKSKLLSVMYKASHGLPTYTLRSTYAYCCSFPCFLTPPTSLLVLYYCLCLKCPLVPSLLGWLGFVCFLLSHASVITFAILHWNYLFESLSHYI